MFENTALIDSDSIYFRVACVTKEPEEISYNIDKTMGDILKATGATSIKVAIKGRGNFRNNLYRRYKGTRKKLEPDMRKALNFGHNYMIETWNATMADGMEADDLVSIWAAECRSIEEDYTIVGIDKDLLQIPGRHYHFIKKTLTDVSKEEGHYSLMRQCLTGDKSDNIPGIKGIGPKKADKALYGIPPAGLWNRVQEVWSEKEAGSPIMSRRLLQMLTSFEELEKIQNDLI